MLTEKQIQLVLKAERDLWRMPETGFREVRSSKYIADVFEELGYQIHPAGDIPGFYADLDTGKPGPTVAIIGELDALLIPGHPEADPETGAVHACGHHAQGAMLIGIAAAMKNPGATDGLCGKIRFVSVPAEELIEMEYREELRSKGIIKYLGGKMEFVRRGMFDGVDMSILVHPSGLPVGKMLAVTHGDNGSVAKRAIFHGVASHAGGYPMGGINALYAATNALNAANALRETFTDGDKIRFHPIITEGGAIVNTIPDRVVVESYVRGASVEVLRKYNRKINRAFAASAAAIGARLTLSDRMGFYPLNNSMGMNDVMKESMEELYGENCVHVSTGRGGASTDLGDLSTLMPVTQAISTGCVGGAHSEGFMIGDAYKVCVDTAECTIIAIRKLLENNGARGRKIVEDFHPIYATKEDYFRETKEFIFDIDAVKYNEDGTVTLKYMQ